MSSHDPLLVQVAFAPNQMIATMWQDVLYQHGIPSVVRTADTSAYLGAMTPSTIHVPSEHAQRARELLDEDEGNEREAVETLTVGERTE